MTKVNKKKYKKLKAYKKSLKKAEAHFAGFEVNDKSYLLIQKKIKSILDICTSKSGVSMETSNKPMMKIMSLKAEAHFAGFENNDELLPLIKNKMNYISNICNREPGKSMKACTPSLSSNNPAILKNHIYKKNQFKPDNIEVMDSSSSTPKYITEDEQAVQSSTKSKSQSSKRNEKRRCVEINSLVVRVHPNTVLMESLSCMVKSMRYVFAHLTARELIIASRVCKVWNTIAMNNDLWKTVCLKNSRVLDWENCFIAIQNHGKVFTTLDTRQMIIPYKIEEFKRFWLNFNLAIVRAKQLKCIKLYQCPVYVVEFIINSFPQLTVLNATTIKNPNDTQDKKIDYESMTLNLSSLNQMVLLTELKLKGLSGIKLTNFPSLNKLVNLKSLAITSIKEFPIDVCHSLETVTMKLEFLEIGDCKSLSHDFSRLLKRFINLKYLRLENCFERYENCAHEVFCSIRSLEKLEILELINIKFTTSVKKELEKCYTIKALLIIPTYAEISAVTNCHLIDCLAKLSSTLTHLIWVVTYELLHVTDLFISKRPQNQRHEPHNNIPMWKTTELGQRPEVMPNNSNGYIGLLSIPDLRKMLKTIMIHTKIKIIKVNFNRTTGVYLTEHFIDM